MYRPGFMDRGEHAVYIASPEWAARRKRFKRDHGYHCDACDSRDSLDVHHIRYDNAGHGSEPDRDLRVLCRSHHELVHSDSYEKSGKYGGFKKRGTLVRATEAMIVDVRAGRVLMPVGRPGSRIQVARPVPARPRTRIDSRGPTVKNRKRRRTGSLAWVATALAVALIIVGVNLSRSSQTPAQRQAAVATVSAAAPAVVPPKPPKPKPYVVRAGDTLERIAKRSKVKVTDLLRWNPGITDPDVIDVGQVINTAAPTK